MATLCAPCSLSDTGAVRLACVQDEARARRPRRAGRPWRARRRPRRRRRRRTAALVRPAIAATRGSSAFSTATSGRRRQRLDELGLGPRGRRHRPELPDVRRPDVEHDPDPRRRDRRQVADVAGPRAPISSTRKRVLRRRRSTVIGSPISLLNDPAARRSVRAGSRTCASRSLVQVLPDEPVMPTTATGRGRGRAARPGQPAQRGDDVVDDEQGAAARAAAAEHRHRTGGERRRRVVVPVDGGRRATRRTGRPAPASRESIDDAAWTTAAAGTSPASTAPVGTAATSRERSWRSPRLHRRAPRHSDAPGRRTGGPRPATSCPCSWPLPATSTTSPGPAPRDGDPRSRPRRSAPRAPRRAPASASRARRARRRGSPPGPPSAGCRR